MRRKAKFKINLRDSLVTVLIIAAAALASWCIKSFGQNNIDTSIIFVLAVMLVARFTNGYFYGIAASIAGVLVVNYIFTYPYLSFNFTLDGYPYTILCSLIVSIATSTLTTRIRRAESMHSEAAMERMRANLLRAVSHDLRTPLTSILGATTAVIENDGALTSNERCELLRGARDDAEWLIRMVENLLSVTRISPGDNPRLNREPEAAEELVSGAVVKFRKRFPEKKVEVRVPDDILFVSADAMLIEQVIINLLENAALHAEGATRMALSVRHDENLAIFEVSDNGCGISKDTLQHLFDGSRNALGGGKPEGAGDSHRNMGIGLSVCHTIVTAHGGTMYAENLDEGGAAVGFSIPVWTEEDE